MHKLVRQFQELCPPAALYFVVSIATLLIVVMQNVGNTRRLSIGSFSYRVPHAALILFIKFIGILFWTYILQLICKDKHTNLSWFLVLLPWVLTVLMMMIPRS